VPSRLEERVAPPLVLPLLALESYQVQEGGWSPLGREYVGESCLAVELYALLHIHQTGMWREEQGFLCVGGAISLSSS
jgi:hypothetical protein